VFSSDGDDYHHRHKRKDNLTARVAEGGDDGGSDDSFEKEMDNEANRLVDELLSSTSQGEEEEEGIINEGGMTCVVPSSAESPSMTGSGSVGKKKKQVEFYDKIYFDSSSSEDEQTLEESSENVGRSKRRQKKRIKLTNDELLYDPNMDDEDERWIQRQRLSYHNVRLSEKLSKKQKSKEIKDFPQSDAVLNCPACMSTLCLDCQRHELYHSQYRAMFVMNCKIMRNEVLHYVPKPEKKKNQQGKKTMKEQDDTAPVDSTSKESYHPVRCNICNTEVAVYDKDQVFHFFNVLSTPN
jgi:predicted nucleic acid binding AN1-type Zn finger protein